MADQAYLIEYWQEDYLSADIFPTVLTFPNVSAMRTWIAKEVFDQRRTDVTRITARQVSPRSHEAVLAGTSRTAPNG